MASPPAPDLPLAPLGPPIAEVTCSDLQAAKSALQAHSGENGYAISVESSNALRVFYRCAKGRTYDNSNKGKAHKSKQRKNTSTMKINCKYLVVARRSEEHGGLLTLSLAGSDLTN